MIDVIVSNLGKYFPEINAALGAGIVIFARLVGFMRFAPVFNRKEIPSVIKIGFVLIMTVTLTIILKPDTPSLGTNLTYSIILNIVFGAILGFIANCILEAISAGGDMINMQMGLSSAMVLDPTQGTQVSILGKYFSLLGMLIFIHVGGIYWLFTAFMRSFEIFPIYAMSFELSKLINMQYLVTITSNVLYVGLQIASPVLLATLGQDIILGIISKTAPQVNVFQLSFLFKPVLGAAILVWIMPILFNIISDYFISFAQIF